MATWVRQGTGTAPSATDADLVGEYQLDNATAPVDFDPANVNSVRCQWTITGSGFGDDSWDNGACALVTSGGTEISQHPSAGGTGLKNTSEASDHTDSTGIPTGLSTAQWESARVRGDGTVIPNEWTLWNKVKGPDGSTMAVSALTVTIDYTPAAASPVDVELVPASLAPSAVALVPDITAPAGTITLVGTPQSGGAGNGGDVTLTFDVAPQQDDVVIAIGIIGDDSAGSNADPTPAGYTKLTTLEYFASQGALVVSYKVMGATPDTGVTIPGSGSSQDSTNGHAYVLRGVDTTNVEDAAEAYLDWGTAANPDNPAITTVTDGAWVFVVLGHLDDSTGMSGPTGYSTPLKTGVLDTRRSGLATAYKEVPTAGTEDPPAWSWSHSISKALFTVAIRPSVATGAVEVELSPASIATSGQVLTPSLTALSTQLAPASLATAAQALTPVRDPTTIPLAPASLSLSAQAFTPSLTALEVPLTPATLQTVSQALNLSLNPLTVELTPGLLTTQAQSLPLSLTALTTELTPATLQAIAQSLTPQISGAAVSVTLVPASLLTQAQSLDLTLGAFTTELVPASLQTLPQAFTPSLSPLAIELTPATLALSAQALGLNLTALTVDLTPATLQTIAQALVPDIASLGVTVELVPASLLLAPQTLDLSLGALSVVMTPATAGVSAQALSPERQALAIELVAASMGVSAQSLSPELQALAVELAPALISADAQSLDIFTLILVQLVPASLDTQALIMDTEIKAVPIPSGSDLPASYRRSRVRRAKPWRRPPSWR